MKKLWLLFFLIYSWPSAIAEPQTQTKQSKSWEFIEASKIPGGKNTSEEAFLTKSVKVNRGSGLPPIYILMEGWESGWDYYFTTDGNWKELSQSNEIMGAEFLIGDFDGDEVEDLLLFLALEEENLTGDPMPVIPRLYKGTEDGFARIALKCSHAIYSYFKFKLEFYKAIHPNSANLPIAFLYEKDFIESCT